MIYFDLDGVIRDLSTKALGCPATHWHHKVDGKTVVDCIREDLGLLLRADPTEYYPLIKTLPAITIITCQPQEWRNYTTAWVDHHLDNVQDLIYVDRAEDKLPYLYHGDWLVEDYPFYASYDQIILIDRPYNKNAPAEVRVCNPETLGLLLNTMKENGESL